MNANFRSDDDVDIAVEKYKDYPSIKMINGNISFELCFSLKWISQ